MSHSSNEEGRPHIPVMEKEVVAAFSGRKIRTFYEGTLGAGGHAKALLKAHGEIERYIGCDKDPDALAIARGVLAPWKDKITLIQGNFADLDLHLGQRGIETVDGFFLTWEFHQCS